jgi:hypothetical protein
MALDTDCIEAIETGFIREPVAKTFSVEELREFPLKCFQPQIF